jgi:hypothetical protein
MTITRVQGHAVTSAAATSLAGTLTTGVTSGNLLVAAVSCGSNTTTFTGPTGWTQATINQPSGVSDTQETSIWWAIVGSGGLSAGSTSWTWTLSASHNPYICIEEWNSTTGWVASPVDKTANGETGTPATATTVVSGTTATTAQASELWVASLMYAGGAQTESSITSGWTKDLETTDGSNNHTVTMLYDVASSTGAAACQYTIGTAEFWCGCVTTFLPVVVTTSSRTIPTTAALQATVSRTIPSTAALQGTVSRTIPSTAALQSTNSRTIPATAAIANNKSRTIPATAALTNSGSRTIPATAALLATNSRTIPTTAALLQTSSRTIPATAALAQSAVFYASNVASTIGGLTQSDQMSQVAGGTETSYGVTMPASGTNSYVELLSQGGTSSGTSALPAPTGKGWSIPLQGNTILSGSWSFAFTLAKSGTAMTGASLYVRAYRRTMDGTYYYISSSILTGQTYSTKAVYTLPSATAALWQFIAGDTLYMDTFAFNGSTAWASDVFTVYVSNSATQGVYNDGIIIAPQMITTPQELACYIGATSLQTGTTLPVLNQSFTLADAIDQRSILTLTGEDVAGTLSYQRAMPVYLGDHDQGKLYDGYVNSDKVSKPAAGNSSAQLEHMLTFMDPHYLVDKRANTTNYLNWAAGDMVCDFIQQTLSQEGITGQFALESDYTPATFGAGTLSGTVATTTTSPFVYAPNTASPPITSNTGDLELVRAGTQFTLTESLTADFASGTLTNMTASSNSLQPTTQQALRMTTTLPTAGPATVAATYTHVTTNLDRVDAKIWSGTKTIGTGDSFNYDIWIQSTSPSYIAGVDFTCNDGTTLTSYIFKTNTSNVNGEPYIPLCDQAGISVATPTDLSSVAKDCWYTRTIPLTASSTSLPTGVMAGKVITSVSVFVAGEAPGDYTIYVKNIYLGSASGSPFLSTSATVPNVNPPVITNTGGYVVTQTGAQMVPVYLPTQSYRVSAAHSISGVGLVQNSNISWTASLPAIGPTETTGLPGVATTGGSMLIFVSYDGTTWLTCTNASALPGLPAGANVSGLSLYLREQFQCGPDPTAIPSLLQVNITINSAAAQTTTDIVANYGTATAWNTGTTVCCSPNGNGDLALGALARDWNEKEILGQTLVPGSASTAPTAQSAASGAYILSINDFTPDSKQLDAASRFDFLGAGIDFTLEWDMKGSGGAGSGDGDAQLGICYRTQDWDVGSNTANYVCGYLVTFHPFNGANVIYLGYGANTSISGPITWTQIATATVTFTTGTTYHFKLVVSGNNHKLYINNSGSTTFNVTDNTYLGGGGIGIQGEGSATALTTVNITTDNLVFTPSGTWTMLQGAAIWTSPSISLNSLGTCGNTQIAWSEINTAGQSQDTVSVQASLDGGATYQKCTNGKAIPGLSSGTSVTGKSLLVQIIMFGTTNITLPVIYGLNVRVCGPYGTVSGTRISPALNLSPVGYVASSNVMWNANIPTSTTLAVQTTQDLSTFHTVGNSGAGEALTYWTNQPAATQDLFSTNTIANYANTNKVGGSAATVTYDTTNSRITLAGGSSALYLNNAISCADVDLLVDMDWSDAGGIVFQELDLNTGDFYEVAVHDASSSSGFTNQLRLYKTSGGTRSLLGSASSITFTRGTVHRIRVVMEGGLINVYWDGNCVQSYLDLFPLGAGKVGLRNDGGTSRYYQLWVQPLGTNLSGQKLHTKVTMTTTDPSVMPQLFTLVTCVRGSSIGTGATVSQLHPITKPFAAYYSNEMDSLVQQSGDYYWYVDKWRQLRFGPRLARPGAFPVQSTTDQDPANPANVHSGYLLYLPTVTVLSAADLFRSQQIVTNVSGLVTPPAETKVADGSTTSWAMGYPLYSVPSITINGQGASVGLQGIDNNHQFYWQPGSASISYDSSLPKLPNGTVLVFAYVGESTVNVVLNNSASQVAQAALELNSGIVAEIETALNSTASGMTTAQATTFGNGLLSRNGSNGTIEMVGTTRYPRLVPGTTVGLFLPEVLSTWNVQLPLVKVTTTAYQGQNGIIYLYTLDCTNGPSLNNWQRVFYAQ